ncbi:MAG: hypothetical protein ACREON_10760, partial [Gemmatimonadaceae bacterium]
SWGRAPVPVAPPLRPEEARLVIPARSASHRDCRRAFAGRTVRWLGGHLRTRVATTVASDADGRYRFPALAAASA